MTEPKYCRIRQILETDLDDEAAINAAFEDLARDPNAQACLGSCGVRGVDIINCMVPMGHVASAPGGPPAPREVLDAAAAPHCVVHDTVSDGDVAFYGMLEEAAFLERGEIPPSFLAPPEVPDC